MSRVTSHAIIRRRLDSFVFAAPRGGLPPIYVVGYPGAVGGASTELWHTLKLWRRFELEVHLVPTWSAPAEWRARCDAIGCQTHQVAGPEQLADVPGLAGSIVAAFCNSNFLAAAVPIRRLGCSVVWVGCMNWLFSAERAHYRRHGTFDAYVFQSAYQRLKLLPELVRYGVDTSGCFHIRGAFDADEFPYQPRERKRGEPFVVGRISRAAPDKFSPRTWQVYGAIPYAPRRARVLGWSPAVEAKLGAPPDWAEALPPGAETSRDFLSTLHAIVHLTGGSGENWPRCGLEAMAAGVPVVAEADYGWPEMIEHGKTGYLARTDEEAVYYAARLAYSERRRASMAEAARKRLVEKLAEPEQLFGLWQKLFSRVREQARY